MKWFKHDTDMSHDLKIKNLIREYGLQGYAVWCLCLELLGREGSDGRLNDKSCWKNELSTQFHFEVDNSEDKLNKILKSMAELSLISAKALESGHLYIPKFKERADNYTSQKLRSNFEESSEKYTTDRDIEEDKKRCKRALDLFCLKYQEKTGSKYIPSYAKDKHIFKTLLPVLSNEEIEDLINRFFDSDDAWIKDKGYTVGLFKSQINKLRSVQPKTEGSWGRTL